MIFILLAGSILLMILLHIQGSNLNTPTSPAGILSLEFAYHFDTTAAVVDAWHRGLQSTFAWNMMLDFIFILFYAGFFYFTCLYYSWIIPLWKKTALLMAGGALFAGGMDVLENILMIISFNGVIHPVISLATFFLAAVKFTIVFLALIFVIAATVFAGIGRKSKSLGGSKCRHYCY